MNSLNKSEGHVKNTSLIDDITLIDFSESKDEINSDKECSPHRDDGRRTTKRQECMRSNNNQKPAKADFTRVWTEYEKQTLLNLLYEHGDSNLEILAAGLPMKHVTQIKTYIRTIRKRAFLAEKDRKKRLEVQTLGEWIEYLKEIYEGEPVDDVLPFELFELSQEFKNPGNLVSNEVVDFQKAYEYLFALTLGRKIDVDEQTYYFVHSYLDWFLSQFDKMLLRDELNLLETWVSRLSILTPSEVLSRLFRETLSEEQCLSIKNLLKRVCSKIRLTSFRRGDDYDRKISLLRAQLDDPMDPISSRNKCNFNLFPSCDQVKFKNLLSFLWAALFNMNVLELVELSSK